MSRPPKRLGLQPGTNGSSISVITNSFAVSQLPTGTFVHYNVGELHTLFSEATRSLNPFDLPEFPDFTHTPKRERALEIIDRLQMQQASMFNPRAAFDGQRNMFRSVELNLANNSGHFQVYFGDPSAAVRTNSKGVKVCITRVATINPRSLLAVINGQEGYGSESLTALQLLNVLVRMKPIMTYPSNLKSFFTKDIKESLGGGLELWRGLFQSVRPTIDRLLVNVDIATAVMYNSGPLIDLILAFLNLRDIRDLNPSRLKPPSEAKLNSFLKGLLVYAVVPIGSGRPRYRKIQKIVMTGADQYMFTNDNTGQHLSISAHYYQAHQYRMRFGSAICVDVGRDIVFPLEAVHVKEGQMFKKTLPPSLAPRALKFSTQKPNDRIQAIQRSTGLLGYGESDFLRHSGMVIDNRLIAINARVLPPPPIQWGGNRQGPDVPRGGAWNVLGKKLYKPGVVKAWAVVFYDTRLDRHQILPFLKMLVEACQELGMQFPNRPPDIIPGRPGVDDRGHHELMETAGAAAIRSFEDQFRQNDPKRPTFILVILPDSAIDIRTSVKSWGDCIRGCPTQCMKTGKLAKANNQYCNNLALKINTKLGGVNSIPFGDTETMKLLAKVPTMVIGADVSHAAPDSDRPSITGMVSSVDEHFCQYVASTRVQESRTEIIADLDSMIEHAVENFQLFWRFMRGRPNVLPHRIIFFRDGVSEGQFQEVGDKEINQIKQSLARIWEVRGLTGDPPRLTFIIVGKRHHIRFFPKENRDADRSGNCPAGMVVDQEVVSPVDYDFYLQSHGGLLGTSRPSHYSVIRDDNSLGANTLQAISYTLCHVYARATRSVSIPAPVYYADIVCARGRFHSRLIHDGSDSAVSLASGDGPSLQEHQQAFKGLAENMKTSMYFM
ncbi:Piwi domain-containing protein [Gautieria morchelliformis]|nr:Piwi domain-containing protein [Gautieria morchelliformis]